MNLHNIWDSQITGSEAFLGEFLKPASYDLIPLNDMLDLIVEYYKATYESYGFRRPFKEGLDNDIIIQIKVGQFGRCRIGSEIFGSSKSLRHVKSSYILSKFITSDMDVDCYPG
jgi:hypothetical protein